MVYCVEGERVDVKILIISHMYPSLYNEMAGIFIRQQVRELLRQGCELKVVSPIPLVPFPMNKISSRWHKLAGIPWMTKDDGVEVYYPRYLAFPRAMLFELYGWFMYQGCKKIVSKIYNDFAFDLIHAHVALPDGYAALLLNRRYQVPLVVTIHGQDLQQTLHKNNFCKKALLKVFKQVDRVIAVSTKLKQIAGDHLGYTEKTVVINNGMAIGSVNSSQILNELNMQQNKTMLSVSNLNKSKGIDLNLLAVSRLAGKYPDLKYIIIGDGPEAARLKDLAVSLGLTNQVEFLGRLTHPEVMTYMAAADIFSLPSWLEAFGIVYLEAMAHEKPVIACQGQGIEDVVEHGKTGLLVKERDVESLVEALNYLLSNPGEAKRMGIEARKQVLTEYTWNKNVQKTLAVYQGVYKKKITG